MTDTEKRPRTQVENGNITQALLDDLEARGYKLWVGENGRLQYEGPAMTPVIWHALQANYSKLARLLGKGVTDSNALHGMEVNSRNAVVELIKNRSNKRLFRQLIGPAVEEAKQAFAQAGAVVQRKVEAGELELSDPREGFWRALEEYDKHIPSEVKEARRLASEARKTAELCGICGRGTQGETVYKTKTCTGVAVLFGAGPKYEDTVACERCVPEYMVREAKGEPIELPGGRLSYSSRFSEWPCGTCGRGVVVQKSRRDYYRPCVPMPDKPGWSQPTAFCCERCQWTFYNARRSERNARYRNKTCEGCGQSFTATRRDAKACSPACKQKAYRQRKKEGPS